MKFDHIDKVRKHLLQSLEKLEKNQIELDEVESITKICDTVFSSLKLQISYNSLTGKKSHIEFLEQADMPISIDQDKVVKLEQKFDSVHKVDKQ